MKRLLFVTTFITALVGLVLSGCNSSTSTDQPAPNTSSATDERHEHDEHAHHENNSQSGMEKMKAELAKLSPEDAASAERQHFCPVSGEMLGTMGAPKEIDVNGQQVWICCEHCVEQLLANPDEYFAKLKKE